MKKNICTNELKRLEKVLEMLIMKRDEIIAEKYLQGFLEYKKVNSLDSYIKNLSC